MEVAYRLRGSEGGACCALRRVLQLGVPTSVGLSLSAMVPKLAGMERQLSKIVC